MSCCRPVCKSTQSVVVKSLTRLQMSRWHRCDAKWCGLFFSTTYITLSVLVMYTALTGASFSMLYLHTPAGSAVSQTCSAGWTLQWLAGWRDPSKYVFEEVLFFFKTVVLRKTAYIFSVSLSIDRWNVLECLFSLAFYVFCHDSMPIQLQKKH